MAFHFKPVKRIRANLQATFDFSYSSDSDSSIADGEPARKRRRAHEDDILSNSDNNRHHPTNHSSNVDQAQENGTFDVENVSNVRDLPPSHANEHPSSNRRESSSNVSNSAAQHDGGRMISVSTEQPPINTRRRTNTPTNVGDNDHSNVNGQENENIHTSIDATRPANVPTNHDDRAENLPRPTNSTSNSEHDRASRNGFDDDNSNDGEIDDDRMSEASKLVFGPEDFSILSDLLMGLSEDQKKDFVKKSSELKIVANISDVKKVVMDESSSTSYIIDLSKTPVYCECGYDKQKKTICIHIVAVARNLGNDLKKILNAISTQLSELSRSQQHKPLINDTDGQKSGSKIRENSLSADGDNKMRETEAHRIGTLTQSMGEPEMQVESQENPGPSTSSQPKNTEFTEIYYHNDHLFEVDLLKNKRNAKKCAACHGAFNRKVDPESALALVISHKERWEYPDENGVWIISNDERNSYIHCNAECLVYRYPYFNLSFLRVPATLSEEQMRTLETEFNYKIV